MKRVPRKYIVDEQGKTKEVILSFKDFTEIEKILGLDLDKNVLEDLREARKDRLSGTEGAYLDLDEI